MQDSQIRKNNLCFCSFPDSKFHQAHSWLFVKQVVALKIVLLGCMWKPMCVKGFQFQNILMHKIQIESTTIQNSLKNRTIVGALKTIFWNGFHHCCCCIACSMLAGYLQCINGYNSLFSHIAPTTVFLFLAFDLITLTFTYLNFPILEHATRIAIKDNLLNNSFIKE